LSLVIRMSLRRTRHARRRGGRRAVRLLRWRVLGLDALDKESVLSSEDRAASSGAHARLEVTHFEVVKYV